MLTDVRDIVRHRWAARSKCGRTGRPATRRTVKGPGPAAGPGEPRMGIPQDPWGTGRPGSQRRGVDRMGDPQDQRHRPRAAADRANLVTVPALPGRGDPCMRLLHRRPARRYLGPRPGRDRARDPAHPHPRRRPAPDRGVDRPPAGPQPAYGPWRTGRADEIHDPRPGIEPHRHLRRGPGGRRDQDRACNVRTPRMNAIAERWIGGCRRAHTPARTILRQRQNGQSGAAAGACRERRSGGSAVAGLAVG